MTDATNEKRSPVLAEQRELSYEQRESRIERGDGEILLNFDSDAEKAGADRKQYKMASDGKTILVPQPSDDPNDPLNWPSWKKHALLILLGLGGWNADFASGVGIPSLALQAAEWNITPTHVNNAGNLGILMLGIGGIFWIPPIHYWGRAPVFFYTQVIGTFMTLGCVLSPNFASFYAFRGLQTFFLTSSQTMGLTVLRDLFFFHELARKLGLYVVIFYASPYVGPQFAGWMIDALGEWRSSFWLSFAWSCMVVALCLLLYDETYYNRNNPHPRPPYSQKRRLLELFGYYGFTEPRRPIGASYGRLLAVIIKPVVFPTMMFVSMTFMWAVGINVTTAILIGSPVELGGYGFSLKATSFLYFSPIISLILGEMFGHWFNDFIANRYIKAHRGVFVPEVRLWPNYLAIPLMIIGLVLTGQTLQFKWNYGVIIVGWGLYIFGQIISAIATTAYIADCYPNAAGETMAFMNLARVMLGFSVGYYQQQWGEAEGFNVSFGLQAAVVAASFGIVVLLQLFGKVVRHKAGPVKLGW